MATSRKISAGEIQAALARLTAGIAGRHPDGEALLLLGIANGGVELARRLARDLVAAGRPDRAVRAGTLDISFHRDDIGRHPVPHEFAPTHIPGDVHGATVILVDDVLFTGRTVKAALDELFDHGRPERVELAILVDRGGRRLPVAPDYCGLALPAGESEKVVVILDAEDPARDAIRVEAPRAARRRPAG